MIAEFFILVLGILFAIALGKSPGLTWLPWILVGLGGLFVLLGTAIFFIPAPRIMPAIASGAVLLSAVGSRWRRVGMVGGILGCVAAMATVAWWVSGDGVFEATVSLGRHAAHPSGTMGFATEATRPFAAATILALEAIVISAFTTRRRDTRR